MKRLEGPIRATTAFAGRIGPPGGDPGLGAAAGAPRLEGPGRPPRRRGRGRCSTRRYFDNFLCRRPSWSGGHLGRTAEAEGGSLGRDLPASRISGSGQTGCRNTAGACGGATDLPRTRPSVPDRPDRRGRGQSSSLRPVPGFGNDGGRPRAPARGPCSPPGARPGLLGSRLRTGVLDADGGGRCLLMVRRHIGRFDAGAGRSCAESGGALLRLAVRRLERRPVGLETWRTGRAVHLGSAPSNSPGMKGPVRPAFGRGTRMAGLPGPCILRDRRHVREGD